MQARATVCEPLWPRWLAAGLGLYAFLGGALSFSGWALDVPRLTDWVSQDVSIQPNTAVLIMLAGMALLFHSCGRRQIATVLGGLVALFGALNLLQYVVDADFGFNHQLLFGRGWGQGSTVTPGRFGPPASLAFILIGTALVLLGLGGPRGVRARRFIPSMAMTVVLLMTFALMGYLYGARNFYAIPWLSAIALQTATMLLALAIGLIVSVPERHPVLLLCERSSAGTMARTVLPILIIMIPSVIWVRSKGYELNLYDQGTSRALGAVTQVLGSVALMWAALLALRRREQRERDADRRKDEFLAMLAHELRNPLAPISNAVAALKMAHGDRATLERATAMMDRQLAQLVRLIDDLLDVNRISRGTLELRQERVELHRIFQQAVETCRPLAERANHVVTVTLPAHPVILNADPVRLSQVVGNLLHNACKFTAPGGRISLSAERQGADVVIAVRDNGIGIPPDKLDGIFEMFAQVDNSLERSQSGLGIGLTLTRRLVELHGGSITARSDGLGQGSVFIVRLSISSEETFGRTERRGQVTRAELAPEPAPPPEEQVDGFKLAGKRRILIVDDNRDSAVSLATLLRLTGNETFVAGDGEEAVGMAGEQRPNVILMDIGMPKLNGYDACRRIRAHLWAKEVIIVALTGWGQEKDRQQSVAAGFDGHLVKPVDYGELMSLLAGLSARVEGQRA